MKTPKNVANELKQIVDESKKRSSRGSADMTNNVLHVNYIKSITQPKEPKPVKKAKRKLLSIICHIAELNMPKDGPNFKKGTERVYLFLFNSSV